MLRHLASGRQARLTARTTIGRGPACNVRIKGRLASGEHAAVSWTGQGWLLRDLGSRNGTWIDARRLGPGEVVELVPGATLAFGDRNDPWQVEAVEAPRPFAAELDGDGVVDGDGGVIAIPSVADPQLMILATDDGWIAEDEDGVRPVHDQDVAVVQGRAWRLCLPEVLERTITARRQRPTEIEKPRLRLRYSRDEEYVESAVRLGGEWVDVPARAPHYMLVVLARERAADIDASDAERGWMHVDALADAMGINPRTVNVHVCRLRQQFGALGVNGLLERRPGTGQIRLGINRIDLAPL